jgi:type VI secretion system protein ImpA
MTDTAYDPITFELTPLVAPIAGENPGGVWLRFEPLYDEVRRMRESDDPALPRGVWQRELKRADWPGIVEKTSEALATKSKDLQLAAWLTEAWLNIHGFPGLDAGLRLLAALSTELWDYLYPPLDESLDARLAPISWVTDKLALPLKQVPITAPAGEDDAPYAWVDSELALYQANLAKSKPGAPPETGIVTHPKFLVSVSMTPAPWYATLASELAGVLGALESLEGILIERAGEEAVPSFAPLRDPLMAIHSFVARVLAERVQSGELPEWAVSAHAAPFEGAAELAGQPRGGGPITSRAEAFQRLRESAEYLMRTEPHSPVPYLVRRSISWEHMSLAELLEELLTKTNDLAAIYALLGIKR